MFPSAVSFLAVSLDMIPFYCSTVEAYLSSAEFKAESSSDYCLTKSSLMSANILAMSSRGPFAYNYKAMVSNNLLPNSLSSIIFNSLNTVKAEL